MIDVARLVGSSPEKVHYFQRGDLEIYRLDPPLGGYRIVAAATYPWAMRAQYVDAEGKVHGRNGDPVSTTLYGVANEALQLPHPRPRRTGIHRLETASARLRTVYVRKRAEIARN
jgi:hypothetical protein